MKLIYSYRYQKHFLAVIEESSQWAACYHPRQIWISPSEYTIKKICCDII